jgi:hypothetical protein
MATDADFGICDDSAAVPKSMKRKAEEQGQARPWLKVFETVPPQLLNAYGEAKFGKLDDADVWGHLSQPLKSGAMYCSELCSPETERRGIGTNRWLHAMLCYCKYQVDPKIQNQNKMIIQTEKYDQFYAELERITPSLEYCLAPKKLTQKAGAASLRSGAGASVGVSVKDPQELDRHASILWEWLDKQKVSKIRMMVQWQSSSGLSFVSGTHHRAMQCFKYHGNEKHNEGQKGKGVSLVEFQNGIKERHRGASSMGGTGGEDEGDFC